MSKPTNTYIRATKANGQYTDTWVGSASHWYSCSTPQRSIAENTTVTIECATIPSTDTAPLILVVNLNVSGGTNSSALLLQGWYTSSRKLYVKVRNVWSANAQGVINYGMQTLWV